MVGNLAFIENKDDIEPMGDEWELLPDGIYKAAIVKSDVMPTKRGDGQYLKIVESIFDEKYGGRELTYIFNISNPSADAQRIGLGKLSSLCKACGKDGIPDNSIELHEIYHLIKVKQVASQGVNPKNGEPYGPKNDIKAFLPIAEFDKQSKSGAKAKAKVEADQDFVPF